MQRLSLRGDTLEELLAMRDRIRSHGVEINPEVCCDPEVVKLVGLPRKAG